MADDPDHDEHRWEDDGGPPLSEKIGDGIKAVGHAIGSAFHKGVDAVKGVFEKVVEDEAPAIAAAEKAVEQEFETEAKAALKTGIAAGAVALEADVPMLAPVIGGCRGPRRNRGCRKPRSKSPAPSGPVEPQAEQPLRLIYADPSTLEAHPSNWKVHPEEQKSALNDLISDVGWAGALLYNERTHRLLDGHGRRELFAGKGAVPVLVGNWTEEQERRILAFLDSTGWMAETNKAKLAELLKCDDLVDGLRENSPSLKAIAEAMASAAKLLEPATDKPVGPSKPTKATDVPDAIWPSDNAWGVPALDPAWQADAVEFPVATWGSMGHSRAMRGTYCFYVADEKFDGLWRNPAELLKSGCPSATEVNYSTHDQTPFAVALWGIYRKRWLARYWQSQGLRVFVDLNVHHDLLRPHPATEGRAPGLLGVPAGWKAYASRAHANRPAALEVEWEIARQHSGLDRPLFLVVGGGAAVKALSEQHGWAWVPDPLEPARKVGE